MKIRLVQMAPELGNVKTNSDRIIEYIDKAAAAQVKLIAFPELALTGYVLRQKIFELAEPIPGPSTKEIEAVAKKHKIYVALGMPELSGYHVYNSAALFGPDGLVGVYRKLFLPNFVAVAATFEEVMFFRRGKDIITFNTEFGKLGIQICHDFFYPIIAHAQALQGAALLINISAAPVPPPGSAKMPPGYLTAPEKFQLFARACAIQNQAYFCYVNLTGDEEGVIFGGGACVVNPMGVIETSLSVGAEAREEVAECEIDLEEVQRSRVSYPLLRDVRPEIMRRATEIAEGI